MKKIIIVSIAILVSIVTLVIIFNITSNDSPLYKNISIKDIEKRVEANKDFTVYVYSKSCPACQTFKPIVNEVIDKENEEVFGLDVSVKKNNDISFFKKYSIESTPTLLVFSNGKKVKSHVGVLSKSELISFLKE